MKSRELVCEQGLKYLFETDGRTAWVHSCLGITVARFSSKGIDVHSFGVIAAALPGLSIWPEHVRPSLED